MTGFGDLYLKFPLILTISVFMSRLNFMLSRVEHEKSFITSGPGRKRFTCKQAYLICVNFLVMVFNIRYDTMIKVTHG